MVSSGGKVIFRCLRPRITFWSRETCSTVSYRASLLILHTQSESRAYWIPPDFHGNGHLVIPTSAFGSVPSLSAHAFAIVFQGPDIDKGRYFKGMKLIHVFPFGYNYILPENSNPARSPDSKGPEKTRRDK